MDDMPSRRQHLEGKGMSNVVGESDEASSDFRRLVASDLAFIECRHIV
jgi:hypothetical protein